MDRTERALASFTGEDEELSTTWEVDSIVRGLSFSLPGIGEGETLGVTDSRLLWLDEDLETVEIAAVEDIEITSISRSSAPWTIRLGAIALTLGLIGTPLLWLFASLSLLETLAPLGMGVLVLALTTAIARLRGQTVEEGESQHFARLRTSASVVQIFADEETLEEIVDAIESTAE